MAAQKRVALVLSKSLQGGASANVAALLMGQLVKDCPDIYGAAALPDQMDRLHAAIRFSTVILQGRVGQLEALAADVRGSGLTYCCFTEMARSLNNKFEEYRTRLAQESGELVGVGVYGDDEMVRESTKKFSLLR